MFDETCRRLLERIATSEGCVVTVGSLNADYTVFVERLPQPGITVMGSDVSLAPGGKSSNQAAQAAKLGAKVSMCGLVGTDANGDFLIVQLAQTGVDTSLVTHVEGPSGTAFITVDATAENAIVYVPGANAKLSPEYVHSCVDMLRERCVLGLCLENPMDTVLEAARICHEAGVTVLLNYSPVPPEMPENLGEIVDVLLINETESSQLTELAPEEIPDTGEALRMRLAEMGFRHVVVTLGKEGSLVIEPDAITRIPGLQVKAVDTTGCGDSFVGTVLASLAAGASLAEATQLATYVSAYAACGKGAQASYGTAEEIMRAFS